MPVLATVENLPYCTLSIKSFEDGLTTLGGRGEGCRSSKKGRKDKLLHGDKYIGLN